jgi:cell division protein FtsQ
VNEEFQQQSALRRTQQKRRGIWLLVPLLMLFIVLIVLSNEWSQMLHVERIVVEGARILSAKDVAAMTGIQPQMLLDEVDLMTVHQRLLNQPYIKSARINRQYPQTVSIVIVEREPIAVLSESHLRYIDADGVVLPRIESSVKFDVPFIAGISGLDSIQNGQKISSEEITRAIEILQTASAMGASHLISEIDMNNSSDVCIYSVDGGVKIILGHDDYTGKFAKLQTFWNEFVKTSDVSRLLYIDLRYDGQVVVKWKQDGTVQTLKTTT